MNDPSELVDVLAPGSLPDDAPSAAPVADPGPAALAFTFSGSGAEYFRIWIVNLLLTVVTLGIYSAWAKTRRLQYFYRNTQLAGASFDFRGDPRAILRGRMVGLVLLVAWHYAFGFSLRAGAVTVALLLAALPFMMRSALRFRLANTFYRGLPFGFAGGVGGAYGVYLLPVALFVLPGALVALLPENRMSGLAFLLYLAWPLIHGAMKRYQHRHLLYGDLHAGFALSTARLAGAYLKVVLVGLGLLLLIGIVVVVAVGVGKPSSFTAGVIGLAAGVLTAYLAFLVTGPLITARVSNLAWSATAFPGVEIACRMKVAGYLRLQTGNVLLTLLTLGLFRPFAAVRTWRYRAAHLSLSAPGGFECAGARAGPRARGAAGDGVADFLDMDLSW